MATDSIAKSAADEADRLGLSNIEFAALTGMSLPWIVGLRRGKAPQTTQGKRAVAAFLVRAKRARSRADLTLPTAA